MSTKCSIAYSHGQRFDFHFYHECFELEDAVHLELSGKGVEYEASAGWVKVRIPIEIWEVIRHKAPAELECAEWTDEQIEERAERKVEEQIAKFQAAKGELTLEVMKSWGYDKPREVQIKEQRDHYRKLREERMERKRQIFALMEEQRQTKGAE